MIGITYIPGAGWCWPVRRKVPYPMRTAMRGRTQGSRRYGVPSRPLDIGERKERYDLGLALCGLPAGWFDYD
jgi:hypothetical protein